MKLQGRRQSTNVGRQSSYPETRPGSGIYDVQNDLPDYVAPPDTAATRASAAVSLRTPPGDMAVQAGINSMSAAAKHDAQSTGTFTRKETTPPLRKTGRTRWNEN